MDNQKDIKQSKHGLMKYEIEIEKQKTQKKELAQKVIEVENKLKH